MINSYKIGMRLLAVAAALTFGFGVSNAQDLINNTGGQINNVGTISMISDTAEVYNDNVNIGNGSEVQNTGTIEFLGLNPDFTGTEPLSSDDAHRVPGLVSYAATAGAQNVHEGYYTDLQNTASSTKNVPDQVYISQDYTADGGTRTYTGTLYYDGDDAGYTQAVAGETGSNAYSNVEMQLASPKLLTSDADISGTLSMIDGSTGGFTVNGTSGALLTVTGNTTQTGAAGDFTLANGGNAQLNGDNTIAGITSVNDGGLGLGDGTNPSLTTIDGTLQLTDNAGNSTLSISADARMDVAATFTNADVSRTNMTFDPASTVDYQTGNTEGIITTVASHQYGNLIVSNTAVTNPNSSGGTNNDVYVATGFTLNGGANVDMTTAGGGTDGYLAFTNATGNPVYGTDLEEVVGNFRREHALTTGNNYIFNNSDMAVQFTDAPDNSSYFEVFVDPADVPGAYDVERDVARKITLNYDSDSWIATVTASYTDTDVGESNIATNGYTEDQIRFFEGEGTNDEKVSTGAAYTRVNSTGSTFGTVQLAGITDTTGSVDGTPDDAFLSTNDLILRAGPSVFYSIAHGRWSNPDTWDEGIEPPTDAEVVVRHTVHAGFVRATDSYPTAEAFPTAMATKITVQAADATFTDPTLMFGKDGTYPTGDPTFATSTTPVAGITEPGRLILEDPTGETVDPVPNFDTANETANTFYNAGLVLFNDATEGAPAFNVKENLINNSIISNAATLSIGQ